MSSFILKTAKTTKTQGDVNRIILQTLLYELQGGSGYVFGLYYIEGRPNSTRERIAVIINDHIDRFKQTTTDDMNIARRFEQMLQAINKELAILGNDFQRISLNHLHCVFGIVTANQLYISGIGNLIVQYMHRTHKARYTIYDLHRQFEPTESLTWDNIFITVLDGELHADDVFYVATPLSTREIAESDIQEILTTLPPMGALKRIEQHAGPQQFYAGICMYVEPYNEHMSGKKINPFSSLEQLNATKETTADILGEPQSNIVFSLQKILQTFIIKLHAPGERSFVYFVKQTIRILLKIIIELIQFFTFILHKAIPYIHRAWRAITGEYTKEKIRTLIKYTKIAIEKARYASRRTYIAWGIGTLVILLIAFGIRGFIHNNERKEQIAHIQEISTIVKEKRDQASARLIFDDREKAQTLLTEAIILLDTAPRIRSEQQEVENLRASIIEILNTTRGVVVPTVTSLATVSDTIHKGIRHGSNLFALGSQGIVYKFNSITNAFDVFANQQSSLGTPRLLVADEEQNNESSLYAIDDKKQLERVTGSGSLIVTSGLPRLEDIKMAQFYNGTLYAFTSTIQQLFRFRAQGDSFDGGTAWIVSKDIDLSSARDIAVDGDIFILNPQALIKFTSGRQTGFTLASVEPPLQEALDVETYFEGTHIYILEPSQKRVLVFNKKGEFINQYIHDDFEKALSITIDEKQRLGYIITDHALLSFPLTHLVQ